MPLGILGQPYLRRSWRKFWQGLVPCSLLLAVALMLAPSLRTAAAPAVAPAVYVFGRADFSTANSGAVFAYGDFNNDGRPDLVAVNFTGNSVSILLARSDGGFSDTGAVYPVGLEPFSAAVGDFNGDGKLDIAIGNYTCTGSNNVCPAGSVSILLGNGDGTFQPRVDYATGAAPLAVIVVDLNHDGIPDLVVADSVSEIDSAALGMVSVLLGKGDGTFGAHTDTAAGAGVRGVIAGDFNNDGKLDLMIESFPAANSTMVTLLLGNGDGTFTNGPVIHSSGPPASIAAGDFNHDGKLDVALVYGGDHVSVMLGNGDGSFQPFVNYAVDVGSYAIAAADLDGDGNLDLITSISGSSGALVILRGKGDGTFLSPSEFVTGSFGEVLISDFNADGKLDVGVGANPGIRILLGNGDGTLASKTDFPTDLSPNAIVAADFNGDGQPDLATANTACAQPPCPGSVSLLLGSPGGTFAAHTEFTVGQSPVALASGDFNGDGHLDLAVVNSLDDSVSVLLGDGHGAFTAHVDYGTGSNPQRIVVGDFNRDGKSDLAVSNFADNSVSILLGNGDGTFRTQIPYPTGPGPLGLVAADFNNDGKLDLATADQSTPATPQGNGLVSVLLGNGNGTFQANLDSPISAQDPIDLTAGDFTGDGKLDLAITENLDVYESITVAQGNGAGSFAYQQSQIFGQGAGNIVSADFNGDGRPDLAAVSSFSGLVAILKGGPGGTFTSQSDYGTGGVSSGPSGIGLYPVAMAVGDFNLDNRPDMAVVNNVSSTASVFLSSSPAPDFFLTGAPPSATVTPGATTVYHLTITPVAGFNQSVSLTCAGQPAYSTCVVSPSSIAVNGAGPETISLTVTTTAATSALALSAPFEPGEGSWRAYRVFTVISLLLFCLAVRSKLLRPLVATATAILVLALTFCCACGGSSGGGGGGGNPGTPIGSYSIIVTGQSATLKHNSAFALQVR